VEYYFDNLSSNEFQRLINAIFISKYKENYTVTPITGADGGSDGEIFFDKESIEYKLESIKGCPDPLRGNTLIQVKHHKIDGIGGTAARAAVITDFRTEVRNNYLPQLKKRKVNNFILITNVPSSDNAIQRITAAKKEILPKNSGGVIVYWRDRLIALLDSAPSVWPAFPHLFAGGVPPGILSVYNKLGGDDSRTLRLFIEAEYQREDTVKFRQIRLQHELHKLYTELDLDISNLPNEISDEYLNLDRRGRVRNPISNDNQLSYVIAPQSNHFDNKLVSALRLLTSDINASLNRIVIEGGPGQGKSTVTQMLLQVYRAKFLSENTSPYVSAHPTPNLIRIPLKSNYVLLQIR